MDRSSAVILFALFTLVSLGRAAQPGAPLPFSAPLRELTWGQLNFLHTTDVHGWHAGHLQEPSYSADWGDYISFAHHMTSKAGELGADLLLVDTGDRVEGNGLYDASDPPGVFTSDLVRRLTIDVICSGNHELYKQNTSEREYTVTAPNFKGNYLASNIDIIDPKSGDWVPLAPRYRTFTTPNQGVRILALGFLFDFTGNANNTIVQPVEETIEEKWFQDSIRIKELDLILVIGHVPVRSKEFTAIFNAIRKVRWDIPIQFFGGHTHIRDFVKYDAGAYALESGRYMETIGFMSIDGLTSAGKGGGAPKSGLSFNRRYIDNNLFSYGHHSGRNATTFPTEKGGNVTKLISEARKSLKLDALQGCAPQNYWLNRAPYPSNDSILSWLGDKVLPDIVKQEARENTSTLAIINSGALRFDIFKGPFTVDTTYSVSPFTGGFRRLKNVPFAAAKQVITLINNEGPILEAAAPELQVSSLVPPEQRYARYDLFEETASRDLADQQPLSVALRNEDSLKPGYTTTDDGGDDGDDTVHSALSFYRVPNCVQAEVGISESSEEPSKVDLVYLEFIQPYVLLALQYLGQDYKEDDTRDFAARKSFTELISAWVGEHWDKDC
ncbi:MAG: hypothetical protein M1825_002983 [Sarcosagium campestre]|nr:MAG: hypothetical protein M1825_002983 [Sarcosagium campestre]